MSQQSLRQASIRAVTSTTYTYEGDWHALWDILSIPAGQFNERMLSYINGQLSTSYTEVNGAMAAFAAANGSTTFQAIGTFTPGFSLDALTLAWSTAASDNTPGFEVSGDSLDVAPVGAQIEVQVSTDVGFTPPPADTELSAVSGNPTTVAVSPALSDGQYWARARLLDSGDAPLTDWSNVVTETIVTDVAPALTSPTAAKTGETTASLGVTTDDSNGTLYWVMTTSATPPSKAQVKAGQNDGGTAAAASGNQAVSGTGVQTVSGGATGLTAGTVYYAYFMHEDAGTNQSNVSAASAITTSPTTSYVTGDRTSSITVTASASLLGGGTASNLVDGSEVTDANGSAFFGAGTNSASNRLIFDYGSGNSKRVTEATWKQSNATTHGVWQWYGSNDGATSDVAIGGTFTLGGTAQVQTELNGNINNYRAYILEGVSGSRSSSPWLKEVEFEQSA